MNEPWYVRETLSYRKERYMDHLTEDELFIRAKDILTNCISINNDGKIAADLSDDFGQFFWVRWAHIIEEYRMRFGDFHKKFNEQNINGLGIPKDFSFIDKVCSNINNLNKENSKAMLYKYGKLQYLESYLKNGNLRISPASFYKDPSLNYAIYDDELKFVPQSNPSKLKMEVLDKYGNHKGFLDPRNGKFEFKSSTDYLVFCLSHVLSPRLFVDFDNADACLIIKNITAFSEKLLKAFSRIKKGYIKYLGMVQYIDPIFTDYKNFDIFYTKHFRYAYQREFRICFIPPENILKLDYIELDLGNLEGCCELIRIAKG